MRSLLRQLLAVGPELAAFILTSPLLGSRGAYAIKTPSAAPSPNLDLSQLGRVAVAGDFDSISLYQYAGQTENAFMSNGSQTLFTRYPNGGFESLGLVDASIVAMCTYKDKVILGGNFTSVAGVQAQSVAQWDPTSGTITPLTGINGKVSALYCDNDAGVVYVGGMFSAGKSTNAMAWTDQWVDLPFAGFNGPVYSIAKNAAGNVVFGGDFSGLGVVANGSTPQPTNAQVINLSGGTIGATGTTTTPGFNDPRNIICKTGTDGPGDTWLLADNTGGWWEGQFAFGFNPTKIRLYNTQYEGRGTKTFYFENLNSGGILKLNFTAADGTNQSCSSVCPLPEGNSTYQDFFFEPSVGMDQFRIFITGWYGAGGGLAGLEMFTSDLYTFAVNEFNQPQCDNLSSASTSTMNPASGIWTQISNDGQTSSDYLSAYLTNSSEVDSNPSVLFTPVIQQSGNYSVLIYTPGCLDDNSCDTRGEVNLTGSMTSEFSPQSTTVSQTNYYDKYDQIYYGYVDITSGFKPSVTLAPIANQPLPQTIVAQRVRFDLVVSTGGLNGLFEYDPNNATVGTVFSTPIDAAGTKLDSGATVNQVVSYDGKTYVAGKFTGTGIQNVMSVGTTAMSLPGGGLNGDVLGSYLAGSTMYLGGNFTSTGDNLEKGLNNVAAFDLSSNRWSALGAGVNGAVVDIVPLALTITDGDQEDCITINGVFSSVNAFGNNASFDANGFAVWVPSKNNWLSNIPDVDTSITGKLLAMTSVPGLTWPVYAGQINSQSLSTGGAAILFGSGSPLLESLGIHIQPDPATTKGTIEVSQSSLGVYTGLFYEQNNLNLTVLGGHFSDKESNGSIIHNFEVVDNSNPTQTVTGVKDLEANSTVISMDAVDSLVFAGGIISGTIGGNAINGLFVYNVQTCAIASPQPPALVGDYLVVNAVATRPESSSVYVGGNFTQAGGLTCPTLCYYDATVKQWNSPGLGLSGTITTMFWTSNTQLIIAGNITLNGNRTTMATYDVKKQTFAAFTGASTLPGEIAVLTPASSSFDEFWAAGVTAANKSAYLSHYSGGTWTEVTGFGPGTTIRGMQLLSLTSSHGSTQLVASDEILMLAGNINTGYGNASAVLYNGTTFEPFILSNKHDGSQGTLARLFVSNPQNLMKKGGGHLAVGFVVLIGLAIALALIFLLVVAGILMERTRRRREGYIPMTTDRSANVARIPPETLLAGLNGGEKGSPPKL